MTRTLLITSGAYVAPELEAEFGLLPAAFLPIGNRRLFVHQHSLVHEAADRLLISLPEDFSPDGNDVDLLTALGFEIVPVPTGLSLGQSVVYVVNMTATAGTHLRILHGDTLLYGIDFDADDTVSVEETPIPGYRWGRAPARLGGEAAVLTGFFSFADTARFVQAVTREGGDFVAALSNYDAARPLRHVTAARWLDCGHVNTYHRSRRARTTERVFNQLVTNGRRVVKTGSNAAKIRAEAAWFRDLPLDLHIYTPAFLGEGDSATKPAYALEYLHNPTLADLFVFGRLPRNTWAHILIGCDEFLTACARYPAPPGEPAGPDLYRDKTLERLAIHASASGLNLDAPTRLNGHALPSLRRIAQETAARIAPQSATSLVHGDFCFSNILYDPRADLVRVIDPRGMDQAGRLTPFGDPRYDIGKLHHSVIGCYDLIVAGYYRLTRDNTLDFRLELPSDPSREAVAALFRDQSFAGWKVDVEIAAVSTLLFLSMLPLHVDDPVRQAALLANGLRLFTALEAT